MWRIKLLLIAATRVAFCQDVQLLMDSAYTLELSQPHQAISIYQKCGVLNKVEASLQEQMTIAESAKNLML